MTSCPGDKAHQLVLMKGAPEIILTKCTHHLHSKQEKEIDEVGGSPSAPPALQLNNLSAGSGPSLWVCQHKVTHSVCHANRPAGEAVAA